MSLQNRRTRQTAWIFGFGLIAGLSLPLWWAAAEEEPMFKLPGDRPVEQARPRPRVSAFVRNALPPIFGPQKEWRSYRSTARINVAIRQEGMLWAGTQGSGLIQWDMSTTAYRFFVPQIESVDARTILSLAAGRNGDMWIGTDGKGVALLREGRSQWKFFGKKEGLPGETINALAVASNGDVWAGTTKGIARYRKGKWKKYTVRQGLPDGDIRAIAQDSSGRIWFSPNIAAPFYMRGRKFVTLKPFPVVGATCIVRDGKGGLWFCSDQGAVHYSGGQSKLYTVSHGLAGPAVQTIFVDASGGTWIGTKQRGISYFRDGQWVTMGADHGLPGLDIRSIVGASRGRLFAVTFLNGAVRYHKNRWHGLPVGIVGNRIHAISSAPDGSIWVGTDSGASRFFQRYWYNYTSVLPNNDVRAFAFSPDGNTWIGTYGGGVVRFDGTNFKTFDTTDGMSSNKIIGAGLTPEGVWFLHPLEGFSLFDGQSWKTFTRKSHGAVLQASHPFSTFHIDPTFKIWAGSLGSGPVVHPMDGGWSRFSKMTGASTRGIIYAVAIDQKGQHWFGTRHGLYRYSGGQLKRFTRSDGLPHDRVLAVALEGEKVWIGTPNGAACYDGSSWRPFTQDMGLASNHVTVITVTPWGTKWFGTKYDGLTIYRGE